MTIIWHNPRCSKSRNTLALLRQRGIEPEIVEYLRTPPSADDIRQVLSMLGIEAGELVRKGEITFRDLGLKDADCQSLIVAMAANPVLIERPVVIHDGKAAIGRPPENVLDII